MALHPGVCPLDCPDACGVLVETDAEGCFQRLKGDPAHPWSRGHLCGKTADYAEVVLGPGRLERPLVRSGGELREVGWEEALERVRDGLAGIPGEAILSLCYAGNMGFIQRHYPRRVMNALGATPIDGGLCGAAGSAGHELVMGSDPGPDVEQIEEADLLLLWGCDARRTYQHLVPRLKALCERGVAVHVIDVYRTDTMRLVERWGGRGWILRPGSDAALALGLVELAFQRGDADLEFLRRECSGAAELRAEVAGRYPLEQVARLTGLEASGIAVLAADLGRARNAWIKTGVGWTRRSNGAMGMRAVCSLAAVLGITDRLHFQSSHYFDLESDVLSEPWRRPADAPAPIRHVALGRELCDGRFRAAVVWGHNPALTVPDSARVRAGLAREDLFLVVHELTLTATAELADVVLPATAVGEHTDFFASYGHRRTRVTRKVCEPPASQRSNVETFREIARRLELPPEVWRLDEEGLLGAFLERNRQRFADGDLERLLAGEPVRPLPPQARERDTPSGRIELASDAAQAAGSPRVATYVPDAGFGGTGRFWLLPAPSVATHNTTYLGSARHSARAGAPHCLLNPADLESLGIGAGDAARLENEVAGLTLPAHPCDELPPGMVRVDGFPDPRRIPEGLGVNALTTTDESDLGHVFTQFSTRVDVRRAAPS